MRSINADLRKSKRYWKCAVSRLWNAKRFIADYAEVIGKIAALLELLADGEQIAEGEQIKSVIKTELELVRKMFATPRRSEIVADEGDLDVESLIAEEEMAIWMLRV